MSEDAAIESATKKRKKDAVRIHPDGDLLTIRMDLVWKFLAGILVALGGTNFFTGNFFGQMKNDNRDETVEAVREVLAQEQQMFTPEKLAARDAQIVREKTIDAKFIEIDRQFSSISATLAQVNSKIDTIYVSVKRQGTNPVVGGDASQ